MGEDVTAPDVTGKVAFASSAWVDIARAILEELVAEHGEPGKSFSVCEVFTDVPEGVADATTAAWRFRIVDKTVTVGEGEIDADPLERHPPQVDGATSADRANMPSYLVELHNRLAVVTE